MFCIDLKTFLNQPEFLAVVDPEHSDKKLLQIEKLWALPSTQQKLILSIFQIPFLDFSFVKQNLVIG